METEIFYMTNGSQHYNMPQSRFQLFAGNAGQQYAVKILGELEQLVRHRFEELRTFDRLSWHQRHEEMPFLEYALEEGLHLGQFAIRDFFDGEFNRPLSDQENVRGKDVFFLQNHYADDVKRFPLQHNLMETLFCVDSLVHSKADKVNVISLYFPFGRGDKQNGKDGIPARFVANQLMAAGADTLLTMDLHADQILGFFDAKRTGVEHVRISPLMLHYVKQEFADHLKVLAPDVGGSKRAQYYAQKLSRKMIQAYKERDYGAISQIKHIDILGNPGTHVFIIDDIVASGGSMMESLDVLGKRGVEKAYIGATHALLVKDAVQKFDKAYEDDNNPFCLMIAADSVLRNPEILNKPWYIELDTSGYIAKAIYEMHTSGSISALHDPTCVERFNLYKNNTNN